MSTKSHEKVQPAVRLISNKQTKITGGILQDRCRKNIDNLFRAIDVESLKAVFASEHNSWYAEPEFCGKYLDSAMQIHATTGDAEALERARGLVGAIIKGQRDDGYLGTYKRGLEFEETFGVWNQNFTIMGLLSWYEETGDEKALACAMRCADFNATNFMRPGGPDLFMCVNQGIEHVCLINQIPRLYRLTGKQLYLDFASFIIDKVEATAMKLISIPLRSTMAVSTMGCLKAAELLICYQGILELYGVTGKADYLEASRRYWEMLRKTQIGVTGNGSISECWTYAGNKMRAVSTEVYPNENCVGVGWMKLGARLFEWLGETRFIDSIEQTLYNHLLGSQAIDGRDFSYYQGLVGRKVHVTDPKQYSCCRYRGMNMLSHLPRYIYASEGSNLLVNLYCPSRTDATLGGVEVSVEQETEYPRSGRVSLTVKPRSAARFALRMRIPQWCGTYNVTVNGKPMQAKAENGYLTVERDWAPSGDALLLSLDMPVRVEKAVVEDRDSIAASYGPLTLALDSRYGTPIQDAELSLTGEALALSDSRKPDDGWAPIVKFEAKGRYRGEPRTVQLVDYASAGSVDPKKDRFKVWIPLA